MRITHVAGIDLTANGWTVALDQMMATAANDNWHQTDIGLLRDYPRPFQLTLITQSTSRSTIMSRAGALLSTLDVSRDYHHQPHNQLRLTIVDGTTIYYVSFWPRNISSTPIQWTGTQYVQQLTIAGDILAPPWRMTAQFLSIPSLAMYNTQSWSFAEGSYWAPGYIELLTTNSAIFGGLWVVETSRGAPSNALGVLSIPNSTPSSTAITIGSVTARQMSTAGTYTFNMIFGVIGITFDVWLHFFSSSPATITLTSTGQTLAVITTNPNQLCYYVGSVEHSGIFTITVVTTTTNAILYPFIRMARQWGRMICYISAQPVNTIAVIWDNTLNALNATRARSTGDTSIALAGALECWIPQQGVLVATWAQHTATITGTLSRYPIAPGLL